MEVCVVISTAAFFMLAMFALVNGREISSMLVYDSLNLYACLLDAM
jgi:hypothetical protein